MLPCASLLSDTYRSNDFPVTFSRKMAVPEVLKSFVSGKTDAYLNVHTRSINIEAHVTLDKERKERKKEHFLKSQARETQSSACRHVGGHNMILIGLANEGE